MNTRKKQKKEHDAPNLGPSPQSIAEVNSIFDNSSTTFFYENLATSSQFELFERIEGLGESIDDLVSASPQSTSTNLMDTTQSPQCALQAFQLFFQHNDTCVIDPNCELPEHSHQNETINQQEYYDAMVIENLQKAIKRNDLMTIDKLIVYVDFNEPYFIQNGHPEKMKFIQFAFCHSPIHFLRYLLHEYKEEIHQTMLNETLDYLYLHATCLDRQAVLSDLLIEHGAQPSVEPRRISLY